MPKTKRKLSEIAKAVAESGLSIYDPIEVGDPKLWITSPELEVLLNRGLKGLSLDGLPLRTRSKVVKTKVCESLGYPVPKSFAKTQPRFPGQLFDTYVQKSNNLQIWNEELSSLRRYVLIRVSAENIVTEVRVVTGETLTLLDTTGTLTQKYQARLVAGSSTHEFISPQDTKNLLGLLSNVPKISLGNKIPTDPPEADEILPIAEIFTRLSSIVGKTFAAIGSDQERNRGTELHRLVCKALGFQNYQDDGRFPDVRQQLIEVKLQTATTIDLGLVLPSSDEPLDLSKIKGRQIRHRDLRYAVFGATTDGNKVTITHLYLTTGKNFFSRFPQFQGKVLNKKLQIPLPSNFFQTKAK